MLETNVRNILRGLPIDDDDESCDFTLAMQNEAIASKGIKPSVPSDFVPILGKNVTYIVMAIIINENDEVLMMQEAKKSCSGQWYLPAGRVEPGENFLDAVKREVVEETGLEVEPSTLLYVECAEAWFRFVMAGNIVGGRLKTLPDAESLQAKWIGDVNGVNLRSKDVIKVVERGRAYYQTMKTTRLWHKPILPTSKQHRKLLLRLVICIKQRSTNKLHVLVSEKTEAHLPFCEINHVVNLHSTLRKFMVDIFGCDVPPHRLHGLLSVEHNGQPVGENDGLCLTALVAFAMPLEEVHTIDKYCWQPIAKDIADALLLCMQRNHTVPLNVIRPSYFITKHPAFVISAVTLCAIIPFLYSFSKTDKFSFDDPQLGFETRGTLISQRLTAWDNLVSMFNVPYGSLTLDPREISPQSAIITEAKENSLRRKKVFVKRDLTSWYETSRPVESWSNVSSRHFEKNSSTIAKELAYFTRLNFFCDALDEEYVQIVITSTTEEGLLTEEAFQEMCLLESYYNSLPDYKRYCLKNTRERCCSSWTLPAYVANFKNYDSCRLLKYYDIQDIFKELGNCYQRVRKETSPNENVDIADEIGCIPEKCEVTRNGQSHANYDFREMITFMLDVDYLEKINAGENAALHTTMIFLPLGKHPSRNLPFYRDFNTMLPHFDFKYIRVAAMDLGSKNELFDEIMVTDMKLVLMSVALIIACVWLYSSSFTVAVVVLIVIQFSLGLSYFVYKSALGIDFFPFMNILAIIITLGIGSDDTYIICKAYHSSRENVPSMDRIAFMELVVRHSAFSIFVTTITTLATFFSSFFNSVTAIRCFSLFAGTAVVMNFLVVILLVPSAIVFSEQFPRMNPLFAVMLRSGKLAMTSILSATSSVESALAYFIHLHHKKMIVLLSLVATCGILAVTVWPKLQVPEMTHLQLFEINHPFEQFDLVYRKKFWFNIFKENPRNTLPLRFVWGVNPVDNGNYMDPHERGVTEFDPTFNLSSPDSQTWLLSFCRRLRNQPFVSQNQGPTQSNCFIETFKQWMGRLCVSEGEKCCEVAGFPYNVSYFEECLHDAMISLRRTPQEFIGSQLAGPLYQKVPGNPVVRALIVEFRSNMSYSNSYPQMDSFFHQVENWSRNEFDKAPEGLKNGWFVSHMHFYDLQHILSRDTTLSILASMLCAMFALFISTGNPFLSLVAIITITAIIFVSVGILILFGWKLNVLESIAISLVTGLSVDFSLHYAVNYGTSARKNCWAVVKSISLVCLPTLMTTLTTGLTGYLLTLSVILPYIKIGTFMIVVSAVSWIYATFFLTSLLYLFSAKPTGHDRRYGTYPPKTFDFMINGHKRVSTEVEMTDIIHTPAPNNNVSALDDKENDETENEPSSLSENAQHETENEPSSWSENAQRKESDETENELSSWSDNAQREENDETENEPSSSSEIAQPTRRVQFAKRVSTDV